MLPVFCKTLCILFYTAFIECFMFIYQHLSNLFQVRVIFARFQLSNTWFGRSFRKLFQSQSYNHIQYWVQLLQLQNQKLVSIIKFGLQIVNNLFHWWFDRISIWDMHPMKSLERENEKVSGTVAIFHFSIGYVTHRTLSIKNR